MNAVAMGLQRRNNAQDFKVAWSMPRGLRYVQRNTSNYIAVGMNINRKNAHPCLVHRYKPAEGNSRQ